MNSADQLVSQRSSKIQGHHLDRWAIVYVRQSHPQQVQRHPESAEVQTKLRERAIAWGWPAQRVLVLDGDQGRSGTTTAGRDDFAKLMSEIAHGHVGLVLGFQINRLAREDEACCRLIKMCAVCDTLLADQDGLYHPLDFNDRLVLTIKGFMGGIELHQIQQRMQAGRLNRAQRGEWLGQVPPGYIVGPNRKLQFDPDEQVQQVIRLVLEQFARLGSICGVLSYMREQQILFPFRPSGGPGRGQLQWRRPHRETLRLFLRRAAYTGAFTWGRHAADPKRAGARVEREPQDCQVFLPDNHPAYISWEQYLSNRRRLKEERKRGPRPGPARTTTATLARLIECGHCGCRMQTRYTRDLRYDCQRRALDYGEPACQSFVGKPLEELVAAQVLQVVTPAGLELSRRAAEQTERERNGLDKHWRLRLERARQDTDRAYRQYNAVEPENRLVARTLERQWEDAMVAQRALQEEYTRFQQTKPTKLSAAELAQIESLAHDLPAIWNSPQTSVEDKRQVIRLLLQRVVVWTSASSDAVKVQLHWTGGAMTEHQLRRSVSAWRQLADLPAILAHIRQKRDAGWTSRRIAEDLNTTEHRTPHGTPFTAANVRQLLKRTTPNNKAPSRRAKKRKRTGSSKST
jgi:DNA invertase Pin-like site-specific DNA recombinase